MTLITPRRLITLHLSHLTFTEALTFLAEVQGRNDASHQEGMWIGHDIIAKRFFGFDEDFLLGLFTVFPVDGGNDTFPISFLY